MISLISRSINFVSYMFIEFLEPTSSMCVHS